MRGPSPGHDESAPNHIGSGRYDPGRFQRLWFFGLRSRAAACLRAGLVFLAAPFRGDADVFGEEAARAGFAAGAAAFTDFRFAVGLAALAGRATFAGFSAFTSGRTAAVTFMVCFGGATVLVFLRTSLPVGSAGAAAAAGAAGGVEFVLPLGRPPFRAN